MELINLLLTIVIISLWCNGVYIITSEGMIGHPIRRWLSVLDRGRCNLKGKLIKHPLRFFYKPLIGCVTCMASIHGAYVYYFLHGLDWNLILCCVCAAWLNSVLYGIYERN